MASILWSLQDARSAAGCAEKLCRSSPAQQDFRSGIFLPPRMSPLEAAGRVLAFRASTARAHVRSGPLLSPPSRLVARPEDCCGHLLRPRGQSDSNGGLSDPHHLVYQDTIPGSKKGHPAYGASNPLSVGNNATTGWFTGPTDALPELTRAPTAQKTAPLGNDRQCLSEGEPEWQSRRPRVRQDGVYVPATGARRRQARERGSGICPVRRAKPSGPAGVQVRVFRATAV
jgi:hypothetical protein